MRAGQALRGSSEFHASGDSNLYLRRHGDQLTLSVEHRAAASISTVQLLPGTADCAVALRTLDHSVSAAEPATTVPAAAERSLEQRVVEHLATAQAPVTVAALRKLCRVRNATLQAALPALVADGQVLEDRAGYALAR